VRTIETKVNPSANSQAAAGYEEMHEFHDSSQTLLVLVSVPLFSFLLFVARLLVALRGLSRRGRNRYPNSKDPRRTIEDGSGAVRDGTNDV
jgi:hypothetical protein